MYKLAYINGTNQGFLNMWPAHPSTLQTTLLLDSYYCLRIGAQVTNCFKRGAVFEKFEKPWY